MAPPGSPFRKAWTPRLNAFLPSEAGSWESATEDVNKTIASNRHTFFIGRPPGHKDRATKDTDAQRIVPRYLGRSSVEQTENLSAFDAFRGGVYSQGHFGGGKSMSSMTRRGFMGTALAGSAIPVL